MVEDFNGIVDLTNEESPIHSTDELLGWINEQKRKREVSIQRIDIGSCSPWYYDDTIGMITNPEGSFFRISGIKGEYPDGHEERQPIILQQEIGFLGLICRKINSTWHFLMQAKIEPGNINYVQISPTIQATKSNFTRKHGGSEPAFLSYFTNANAENILVDQIQSEQSSRFLGKRNRNVIIKTNDDIPESDVFHWMTLSQIRFFMKIDNAVNMDTRTVLSCLPYVFFTESLSGYPEDLLKSFRSRSRETVVNIFRNMNRYKMFCSPKKQLIPLYSLKDWHMEENAFRSVAGHPFELIFCEIAIQGREVAKWNQPLFAARGAATFGLICARTENGFEILVTCKDEIGCFDSIEIGPSVQEEYGGFRERDSVGEFFFLNLDSEKKLADVMLSEEGGRFYHEQNRNVVIEVDKDTISYDPERYVWASLGTLNSLIQVNNCLNIQLRNLLVLFTLFCR